MGGSKPTRIFFWGGGGEFSVFFCTYLGEIYKKSDRGVEDGCSSTNPSFSRIFELTRPPKLRVVFHIKNGV